MALSQNYTSAFGTDEAALKQHPQNFAEYEQWKLRTIKVITSRSFTFLLCQTQQKTRPRGMQRPCALPTTNFYLGLQMRNFLRTSVTFGEAAGCSCYLLSARTVYVLSMFTMK